MSMVQGTPRGFLPLMVTEMDEPPSSESVSLASMRLTSLIGCSLAMISCPLGFFTESVMEPLPELIRSVCSLIKDT